MIEEYERQLTEKPPEIPKSREVKKVYYRPIKGDLVDELVAKYINEMQCPLPVKRLGDGNYIFGTKKCQARIMNGRLVVRVGGGYMSMEEFLKNYADFEVQKVQQLIDKGAFNIEEYENQMQLDYSPSSKICLIFNSRFLREAA